jgi:hypothetical protein
MKNSSHAFMEYISKEESLSYKTFKDYNMD